jgi:hypothetical protein
MAEESRFYICCLRNREGGGGLHADLFYTDPAEAEKFKQKYDKPGFGIYDCISMLAGDRRRKENVRQVDYLPVDIDIKDLADTSVEDVVERLTQCLLQPTEIRISGHGVHAVWTLKETVEGPGDLAHAETVLHRLLTYFGGDPSISHFAALLRAPRTHNTKSGDWIECRPVGGRGPTYDLIDIEDGLDDVEERPLFTRTQKAANGHGGAVERAERAGGPLDVDACLEAMEPSGAGANDAQPRAILSLLQTGMHPADVVEKVVDATMQMAERNRLGWTRPAEVVAVTRRAASGLTLLHREYDADTGEIPSWLAGEFHASWIDALAKGLRPQLTHRAGSWYVRAYGHDKADIKAKGEAKAPRSGGAAAGPDVRFRILAFGEMRPGAEPLYLIDELLPIRGLVDIWGKPKCFKSFITLDMMLHVAMGWEYQDRAVRQGTVVYCAFEGAHGYKKRVEALRRHYQIDSDDGVPLYVMPGQANLIKEHAKLILDLKIQLGDRAPAAVVLDTLNKSLIGSESKDIDMSAYLRAAEAVRDAFSCVVIIVHHCGLDETRPRGHTALPGAVDAQLAVVREGANVTVTVEMMRDGPEDTAVTCVAKSIEVGQDNNGKILTSLVMVPGEVPVAARRTWPKSLTLLRVALAKALASADQLVLVSGSTVRATDLEAVRAEFYATYIAKGDTQDQKQDTRKHAFYRNLSKAQKDGLVGVDVQPDGRTLVWAVANATTEPEHNLQREPA